MYKKDVHSTIFRNRFYIYIPLDIFNEILTLIASFQTSFGYR